MSNRLLGRLAGVLVPVALLFLSGISFASQKPGLNKSAPPSNKKAAAPAPCPDCAIHVVAKGEGLDVIARQYIDRTRFLTLSSFESAMTETNGWKNKVYFHPGEKVLIPGMLKKDIVERPNHVPRDFEARGIYMTEWVAGSDHGMDLIRRWKAAGGNTVVFALKDMGGIVAVPFQNPLNDGCSAPPIRSLPKFVHFLHQQRIHVVARIALFRDSCLAEKHPELDPVSRKSGKPWRENGKQVWVDPSLRQVQDYNLALARMAAKAGVDEIQFDYVRFPAEGDQADARFAFQSKHSKWQRSDVIDDFLKRAYHELHPLKVLVSLDVFGVMAWQRPVDLSHTGQDIPKMSRHCDVLSPMIYPSHFFGMDGIAVPGDAPEHFISESMERFRKATAGTKVVIRPWLQAFGWRTPDYSSAYIVQQVKTARQEGGIGFLFWNARSDYDKVFPAMTQMRAEPGKYFQGDGLRAGAPKESEER